MSQTFSTLSQAVQLAHADYGDISTWGYQSRYNSIISTDEWSNGGKENLTTTFARKYFIPYLRISKDLGYSSLRDVGYDEGFNILWHGAEMRYVVVLNNGVYLFFTYNNSGSSDPAMHIYLNYLQSQTSFNHLEQTGIMI